MTRFITNPREQTRFKRFLVVGLVGFIVDFGIENLLHRVFGVLPFNLAGDISFICAVLSNFYWNRVWTYTDSRSKPIRSQLFQFTLVNAIGLLVIRNPVLTYIEPPLTNYFSRLSDSYLGLPPDAIGEWVTFGFAVVIVLFWNFFVNRFWTYSDVK